MKRFDIVVRHRKQTHRNHCGNRRNVRQKTVQRSHRETISMFVLRSKSEHRPLNNDNYVNNVSLNAADWSYLGEGALSIVFAANVDRTNPLFGNVLRLKKTAKKSKDEDSDRPEKLENNTTASTSSTITTSLNTDAVNVEQETHTRQCLLIERLEVLLGDRYAFNGTRVAVTAHFCAQLGDRVAAHRPQRRQDKCLDLRQRFATLMPDVTRCFELPKFDRTLFSNDVTLTVEIKPKWGFLPDSVHVRDDAREIKCRVCRFCLHQHQKRRSSNEKAVDTKKKHHAKPSSSSSAWQMSRYCPLALFSDRSDRVDSALMALLATPQNNLQIFCNGIPLLKELHGSFLLDDHSTASPMLLNVLRRFMDDNSSSSSEPPQVLLPRFVRLIRQTLAQSAILSDIRRLQMLAGGDVDVVQRMATTQRCDDVGFDEVVSQFHTACVMKDCSIMISLRQLSNAAADKHNNGVAFDFVVSAPPVDDDRETRRCFAALLAIVDLDDKSHHSIDHYFEIDRDVVETYRAEMATNHGLRMKSCS